MSQPSIPKAVLYYYPLSVWSAVALLTLEEKGYGAGEIDRRVVDLCEIFIPDDAHTYGACAHLLSEANGENYDPTFIRINRKATVPTLVVPFENTLTADVESRFKAITETKTIVDFLDKSRSAISHTHTISTAPAPSLTPATIAFTEVSKAVIDELHSARGDPNFLRYANASDDVSLAQLAKQVFPAVAKKWGVLEKYLADARAGENAVPGRIEAFWTEKKDFWQPFYDVLKSAGVKTDELDDDDKLKRAEFFAKARTAWEKDLPEVLICLGKEMIGPLDAGDQVSVADMHLGAWLARVACLVGAKTSDDGNAVTKKLEERTKIKVDTKLSAFWDAMQKRASWTEVYGAGLY